MRNGIVVCIDVPDPDNWVLVEAVYSLFPGTDIAVLLTGRPVLFDAKEDDPTWDWDVESSQMVQQAGAARLKKFMSHCGVQSVDVYDGGIAPRTPIPHHRHFRDYHKFDDIDPVAAIRHSELLPQGELVKWMLARQCRVAVGGPMTGLRQVIERNPRVADTITEVHAMFATWGTVNLMDLGGGARGARQFNVATDPLSAAFVLKNLTCPTYLMPTEVTRHPPIGFRNPKHLRRALPNTKGAQKLLELYTVWYEAAVKPRQATNSDEMIYIHDLVAAFSLDHELRDRIYDVVPIVIEEMPTQPSNPEEWGVIKMRRATKAQKTHLFAARGFKRGGEKAYLSALWAIFS